MLIIFAAIVVYINYKDLKKFRGNLFIGEEVVYRDGEDYKTTIVLNTNEENVEIALNNKVTMWVSKEDIYPF